MSSTGTPYHIRSAAEDDAEGINSIQTHYILHSKKTIYFNPFSVEATEAKIHATLEAGYPFLVAVGGNSTDSSRADTKTSWMPSGGSGEPRKEHVLAYACLSPFRSQEGWAPTAELSLFVDSEYTGQGIGRALMIELIQAMRKPDEHLKYFPKGKAKQGIRNILAVAVVDEDDLEGYYRVFRFEKVGFIKEGGEKDGVKWVFYLFLESLGMGGY